MEAERQKLFLMVGYVAVMLITALLVANTSPLVALAIIAAVVIFVVSFVSTEAALYLLIASMLLSPEFGSRGTGGQGATLRLDDFLLLVIGLSWLVRMAVYKELGLFRKTPLNRPIFIYILICLLSTSLGILAGRVALSTGFLFVLKYVEYFVVYFMVTHYLSEAKQVKNFLTALFVTCAIVCLVAIAQIPSGERVTAPFEGSNGEPNTLGGYLVFTLALVSGLIFHTEQPKRRLLLAAFAGLIFIPFLFTLSRSSWIALFPMYGAMIVTSDRRIFLILALALALLLGPFILPESVKGRIDYTFQNEKIVEWQTEIGNVTLDTSSSARIHDWKLALQAFLKKPLFGYGITGWQFIDSQYVRTLVELGLVGFASFLYLLYAILREVWQAYRRARTRLGRGLAYGLFLGTIALMTHSIGANTFIIVRIMEPFWFVTAMVMMLPSLEPTPEEEGPTAAVELEDAEVVY